MIGTILNVVSIGAGSLWAAKTRREPSQAFQQAAKLGLGVAIVWVGLEVCWDGFGGGFKRVLGQLGLLLAALTLGNISGRLLRLQKAFNWLGQKARRHFETVPASGSGSLHGGVVSTCAILFCATPISILGAIVEGLAGNPKPLVVKAVMDGLAAVSFTRCFGRGVLAGMIPVLAFQGSMTLAARWIEPMLHQRDLVDPVMRVAGLLVFCVALVVLEIKRVEIANYLPSLVFAPFLIWVFR